MIETVAIYGGENMPVIEAIRERRSIRKYKADKIKDEDILQIIEAARLAPSGSNTQPWKFIIIKDEATKKKIVEVDHKQKWMLTAPVFIVCVSDIRTRIEDVDLESFLEDSPQPELKLVIRDTAIAISYMLLEAQHLKLGTCWTGWYEQEKMRKVLELPEYLYVSGVITLGYADEKPEMRPRKSLDEIVRYEKW